MDNFKLSKIKINKARLARNLFSILNYVKCSLENEVWDYGQDKNYLVTSEVWPEKSRVTLWIFHSQLLL